VLTALRRPVFDSTLSRVESAKVQKPSERRSAAARDTPPPPFPRALMRYFTPGALSVRENAALPIQDLAVLSEVL